MNRGWLYFARATRTVLRIFEEMGRELGYRPRTEYLDVDMIWPIRHEDMSMIAVAIEHENGDLGDVIDDELQKLTDIKANLKVLMFYPGMETVSRGQFQIPQIIEKIQSTNIKSSKEKYIVITPVARRGKSGHAEGIDVFASEIGSDGKWEDLGSSHIDYNGRV